MQIRCKACGAPISKEDIDLELGVIQCHYCDALFSIHDQLEKKPSRSVLVRRGPVPMPHGIQMEELGSELVITRRWFTPVLFFLLFFCIAWDSFLFFWYFMAFGGDAPGPFNVIMIIFPIGHVAVGVGLTYFTIAGFLNKTTIRAGHGYLSVQHGPIPWPGQQHISATDIEQLYCKQKMHQGKNGTGILYQVHAVQSGGKQIKLVSNLQELDQALFIEQQLERWLHIEDRAIAGEVPRS